jgi:hypothetical protein
MARRIPAGSQLVFQVHYTPIGTEQFDQSRVGFLLADPAEVQWEVKTLSAHNHSFQIPPRDGNYRVEAISAPLPPAGRLLELAPHMHLRGKAFRFEARTPDGQNTILLDVPRYDFNWQTGYRLATPLELPAGTRLHCTAHFDNSAANVANPDPDRAVRWGPQTWDEVMIGYFDIAVPRGS